MSKTIFIKGVSRGFGRIWAEAFLDRGDKVVATLRNINRPKELADKYESAGLPLELDITSRAACFTARKAKSYFGSVDVIINLRIFIIKI